MIIKLRKNIRFSKWMFCCIQEKWLKKIRYRYCCYVEWSDRQVTQSIAIPEYIRIPMDPHWNEWGSHFTVKAPNILLVYLVALLVNLGGLTVSYELLEVYREPFFEIFFFPAISAILGHWLPLTTIDFNCRYPKVPFFSTVTRVKKKKKGIEQNLWFLVIQTTILSGVTICLFTFSVYFFS